ncbi:MAG: hypothetical protein JWP22_3333 [Ramlibacter sp.]|jgi:hypothetical protein|nr:hypothetical protein [Ramlibacter sp.]MDB5914658.1 hypothetical protein [Ramlibacter sp.]
MPRSNGSAYTTDTAPGLSIRWGTAIIRRMDWLRHARFLARTVLAWFVLTISASVAAPVLKPSPLEAICSGSGGLVLVEHGGSTDSGAGAHSMQCPLCASFSAPPFHSSDIHPAVAARTLRAPPPQLAPVIPSAAPQRARGPPPRT